jgi:hypothetical protein
LAAVEAWSSPAREKAHVNFEDTDIWLMRGNLAEMEVMQARAAQIEGHMKKEKSRKRISKGGSVLAIDALDKIAKKRRKEADEVLRKATIALTRAQNKQTKDLKQEGIANRAAKKERI